MIWWLGGVVVVGAILTWVGRRSGVTTADLRRVLPGDELVAKPNLRCDRATIIEGTPEQIWPWVVQLGKARAGWYAPRWLEVILVWKASKRGARDIKPEWQSLTVGEVGIDYGGGFAKLARFDPRRNLVYLLGRHIDDPQQPAQMVWTHVLEPVDATHTRYYIRLRGKMGGGWWAAPLRVLGGTFDYVTIVAMYAGLKQRLKQK